MRAFCKRTIGICVVLCTLLSALSGEPYQYVLADQKSDATYGSVIDSPSEYSEIYSNSTYRMEVRSDIGAFRIVSVTNNEIVWNSIVTDEVYPGFSTSTAQTWQDYMESLVAITYISKSNIRNNSSKAYSAKSENSCKVYRIEDGFRAEYYFKAAEIGLAVEVRLCESGLDIKIPYDSLSEKGDYYLESLELIPFFGAADSNQDGYIMYPDGNGALSYFKRTDTKHLYAQAMILPVYSDMTLEELLDDKVTAAMLPVYGIQRDGKAFLAAITEGDTAANIRVNTDIGSAAVNLNYAGFQFIYRHTYRLYLSNVTSNGKNTAQTLYGSKLDDQMITGDRSTHLFFLPEDSADYSGMAKTYREYLIQNNRLNRKSAVDQCTVALNLLCGVKENGGIFPKLVRATTFGQAESIIQGYSEHGVDSLQIMLRGWNKSGYGTDDYSFKPAWGLGGGSGLRSLCDTVSKLNGYSIFLESDIVYTRRKNSVVNTGSSIPATNSDETLYLKSPVYTEKLMNRLTARTSKYEAGIALEGIASKLYKDYRKHVTVSRNEAKELFAGLIENSNRSVMVQGGNLYALKGADRLYDIPTSSDMNQIVDQNIPFYSMVVYNSIPYTSDIGNLSYDFDLCKLKWIEYGCMPCFEITEQNPNVLFNTDYTSLFSSENSDWEEKIIKMYDELSERLSGTYGTFMKKHSASGGISRIEYENGTVVWLNYNDTDAMVNGRAIQAKNYLVEVNAN